MLQRSHNKTVHCAKWRLMNATDIYTLQVQKAGKQRNEESNEKKVDLLAALTNLQ